MLDYTRSKIFVSIKIFLKLTSEVQNHIKLITVIYLTDNKIQGSFGG